MPLNYDFKSNKAKKEPSERFDLIKTYLNRMAGGTGFFGFDNSVYLSEQTHADRNKALAYHMNGPKLFLKERI